MGKSWHIPYISSYQGLRAEEALHVVFLQRLSEDERTQILQNLNEVDQEWASQLEVPVPSLRKLKQRKWIRDYWPSSNIILEISKDAYSDEGHRNISYRSIIFVDSGWEAGNVVAAHWESQSGEMRLNAARVPMDIANLLLTACDAHEGYGLSQVLGNDVYEESKLDFYADASPQEAKDVQQPSSRYQLPACLPQGLALNRMHPVIISLTILEEEDIESLLKTIINGDQSDEHHINIKIYNWQGSQPRRADIPQIYHCMHENTADSDRSMPAFFIDFVLREESGEPQIVAATKNGHGSRKDTVQTVPIQNSKFLPFWRAAADGKGEEKVEDVSDIWSREDIYDLDSLGYIDFDDVNVAPVIFLQPFTPDDERTIRFNLSEKSDIEKDEVWGSDWTYLGYLWSKGHEKRTLEDLRNLFESCDPFSPSFDPQSPEPFRMRNYPPHFIAVDDRALDAEPKVILASSLDFHGDIDASDELGWHYGVMEAKEAYLAWVNLDVANMGPADFFEPEKLWLSDLKEYAEHDYDSDD